MTRRDLNIKAPDDFASAAEWANAYRALGLAVIPASGNKKIPLGEWKEFQGGIPQPVHDRWYGAGGDNLSNYRMGFLTGAASIGDGWKLLLIDLDEKGAISGNATWDHWIGENELGVDPETWRARTGGGGQHIYFKYPADLHIRNTQETIAGIDVRAEGGFVIAPPSLHASGRPYTWLYSPFETELAEAPQWLLDKVGASARPFDASPREKGTTPEHATDTWGNIVDGRDAYMRDVVWAAVVDLYRECPIQPPERESETKCLEAYATYLRRVRPQELGKSLEDEGRGITAFRQKWAYAMRQWDGKVHEAAGYPSFKDRQPTWDFDDELIARRVDPVASAPALVPPVRFVFETIGDLRKRPPAKWLVDGWIPEGAMGIFYGKWAAGKSFIAFDLGLHIAYSMETWHGVKLPEGGADVLVIAREGHQGFVQRIDAFKQHYGLVDDTDRIFFMRASVSFQNADDFKALCTAIQAQGRAYRLVLIDTVARVLPGADMNTQETATAFMERCAYISQITTAATIGVHHQNKSGGMMGSTYFEANADFVFEVERHNPDETSLQSGEITCTKMKDGEDNWKRAVRYEKIATGPTESSLVVKSIGGPAAETTSNLPPRETCRAILDMVRRHWDEKHPLNHTAQAKASGKYAPRIIGKAFGLEPKVVDRLILEWIDNDILRLEIFNTNTKAKGLRVIGSI